MPSVDEVHRQLFHDVNNRAYANGSFIEEEFCLHMAELLEEQGEIDVFHHSPYASRGIRVDGYGGDPAEVDGVLTLVVSDFLQDTKIETLTESDMNDIFKRVLNFVVRSADPRFRNELDESLPAFGLADLINNRWKIINKIRLILISNRILSSRVDGKESTSVDGRHVTHNVWDLGRLYRLESAGSGREAIEIDFDGDFGGAIPCLPASLGTDDYEAYLVVIPGDQLASLYDRWGTRLLEQNVRVFLQARGNVNKGIRFTIEHEPEMFFAYNNGISATATSVQLKKTSDGLAIAQVTDLQIVNGGQTTASIYSARRDRKVDLSDISVQMKLSIVRPEMVELMVPKISEYANTQNKVNAADFFSNHPFHQRVESFSRRIFMPTSDGSFRETKWFYERARGQYLEAKSRLTKSEQTRFETEFPRGQVFTKTDLAKFDNLWLDAPHIVSRGAQKNFAEYARHIGRLWESDPDHVNEAWYRGLIAKAIIFREVERLVKSQAWYEGGYRANVVAYAIAKLAHDANARKGAVDLERVWRRGEMFPAMVSALLRASEDVHGVITHPPSGAQNVTEWAKQGACWDRVKALRVDWPAEWLDTLLSADEHRDAKRQAVKEQKVLSGIESQMLVINAGRDLWESVLTWARTEKVATPSEESFLRTAAGMGMKMPTEKQCQVILKIHRRLVKEGCPFGRDLS